LLKHKNLTTVTWFKR